MHMRKWPVLLAGMVLTAPLHTPSQADVICGPTMVLGIDWACQTSAANGALGAPSSSSAARLLQQTLQTMVKTSPSAHLAGQSLTHALEAQGYNRRAFQAVDKREFHRAALRFRLAVTSDRLAHEKANGEINLLNSMLADLANVLDKGMSAERSGRLGESRAQFAKVEPMLVGIRAALRAAGTATTIGAPLPVATAAPSSLPGNPGIGNPSIGSNSQSVPASNPASSVPTAAPGSIVRIASPKSGSSPFARNPQATAQPPHVHRTLIGVMNGGVGNSPVWQLPAHASPVAPLPTARSAPSDPTAPVPASSTRIIDPANQTPQSPGFDYQAPQQPFVAKPPAPTRLPSQPPVQVTVQEPLNVLPPSAPAVAQTAQPMVGQPVVQPAPMWIEPASGPQGFAALGNVDDDFDWSHELVNGRGAGGDTYGGGSQGPGTGSQPVANNPAPTTARMAPAIDPMADPSTTGLDDGYGLSANGDPVPAGIGVGQPDVDQDNVDPNVVGSDPAVAGTASDPAYAVQLPAASDPGIQPSANGGFNPNPGTAGAPPHQVDPNRPDPYFAGIDPDPVGQGADSDPTHSAWQPAEPDPGIQPLANAGGDPNQATPGIPPHQVDPNRPDPYFAGIDPDPVVQPTGSDPTYSGQLPTGADPMAQRPALLNGDPGQTTAGIPPHQVDPNRPDPYFAGIDPDPVMQQPTGSDPTYSGHPPTGADPMAQRPALLNGDPGQTTAGIPKHQVDPTRPDPYFAGIDPDPNGGDADDLGGVSLKIEPKAKPLQDGDLRSKVLRLRSASIQ